MDELYILYLQFMDEYLFIRCQGGNPIKMFFFRPTKHVYSKANQMHMMELVTLHCFIWLITMANCFTMVMSDLKKKKSQDHMDSTDQ